MKNWILYLGLGLAVLFLGIVMPLQLFSGNFKPSYIFGLLIWGLIAVGCWSELKRRKGQS